MSKTIFCVVWAVLTSSLGLASDLSPVEMRWLKGMWPVLVFAKQAGMPLDITVQPQPMPDAVPLALGFVDGRCKLVLSMRGNAQAQGTLDRIEPDLLDATLELMAAHELGHCRRYLDGTWLGLPAGFTARLPMGLSPELSMAYANMKAIRREEGYADLVGLAWAHQHHQPQYTRLHAWLLAERLEDLIPGSHHDTLAWLRVAADGSLLGHPSIFSAAAALWGTELSRAD